MDPTNCVADSIKKPTQEPQRMPHLSIPKQYTDVSGAPHISYSTRHHHQHTHTHTHTHTPLPSGPTLCMFLRLVIASFGRQLVSILRMAQIFRSVRDYKSNHQLCRQKEKEGHQLLALCAVRLRESILVFTMLFLYIFNYFYFVLEYSLFTML